MRNIPANNTRGGFARRLLSVLALAMLTSYAYSIPSEDVTDEVTCTFTPASGADLAGEDEIEIFITGESLLTYDGVQFDYAAVSGNKTVVVPNSEIEKSSEDDGVLLIVQIPSEARLAYNVEVTLANLTCLDGKSRDISAQYNLVDGDRVFLDFLPTYVFPDTVSTYTVKELQHLGLSFDENSVIRENFIDEHPIVVYAADGSTQVATAGISVSFADVVPNELCVELSKKITDNGVYHVVFPEMLIGNEAYAAFGYVMGRANPEFTLSFEVVNDGGTDGISDITTNATSPREVYTISGTKLSNQPLHHGVYIVDGKKIVR